MTDYVPMYDNVGIREQATPTFKGDVTYAKLSPDTLLKKRTVSEQYQVPVREHSKKHQKKSSLLIAAMGVLLTLLSVGTITAIILASIQFQQNTKLSAENIELSDHILEMQNSMATVKEKIRNIQGSLSQMSLNECSKQSTTCNISPRRLLKPSCETTSQPVDINVSNKYED